MGHRIVRSGRYRRQSSGHWRSPWVGSVALRSHETGAAPNARSRTASFVAEAIAGSEAAAYSEALAGEIRGFCPPCACRFAAAVGRVRS